jgi:biotin carboxylase
MTTRPHIGLLFDHDWDALGHARHAAQWQFDRAGFDLFSFPSNAGLVGFDLRRFAAAQARRGRRRAWVGVSSQHEQFGALAAALTAEALGLPGTRPEAVLAAQHKVYARQVLDRVAPEANLRFAPLDAEYGDDIPDGLAYPCFVKPVKAAFSVLARTVHDRADLQRHTRFGWRELWVIRRLVEPFEQVMRERLPQAGTAHRMMLEEPVPQHTAQYNLDGWVFEGQAHALGVVDAVMYPRTQAFMRWELPSRLPAAVQAQALDVARRFLAGIGFTHGLFNLEFFHDAATGRLSVIECNPRLASQFSDLYLRVLGIDPHALALALATGQDPARVPRVEPVAGAAGSLVYRAFPGEPSPAMPSPWQVARLRREFPEALLFSFPRSGHSLARDYKWLGSWRYGIVHLHGRDEHDLRERVIRASQLLGWRAPYADTWAAPPTAPAWPVVAGSSGLRR